MKNKKILVGAVAGIIAIILLITAICISVSKTRKAMSISTPELARAMNYEQFEEGDDAIDQTDNVKFSAFFLRDLDGDGYAEKIKGTCKQIGEEDTLYIEINVLTEGYLKNAKIEIAGNNFYFQTSLQKDEQLKDNYIGNNIKTIEFNQLNSETQKLLTGVVRSGDYSYASTKASAIGNNINNYSRTDNKIILTGTYVGIDGEETAISKEISLEMDWYGTAKAEISSANQTYIDLPSRIDEENETVKLNFTVNTNETNNMLNLSKNRVEGTIPPLNGYAPTEVKMTSTTSENLSFEYDEETRTFSINRTATTNEDGTITTTVSRDNSYVIEVTYPLEAYQSLGEDVVSIKIPVSTYYEGYNNPNTEFTNPYKSNVAKTTIVANYSNPQGSVANFAITVGKKIYSPVSRYIVSKEKPLKIYNGTSEEERDDTYIVRWYAYTGTDGETSGIVMKETKEGGSQVTDEFIKTNETVDSMGNVTSNVGIYFTGADNVLKEDGWIKVYDEETDNLLVTFTKNDWGKYTSSNPYKYELPVKHIRIETSETNKESALYVYNIKELDDEYITTNYTKEEFDNLQYIKSTLNGYLGGNYIKTVTHEANYGAPYSIATISIINSNISTQATEKNEKIKITTERNMENNQLGWGSGSFLVKLPEEILVLEINSVEVNNSNITISSYEIIENDEGKFIKISTENSKSISQTYTITIDTDMTPDPRIATTTGMIELYASDDEGVEYYYKGQDIYDVNGNLNTTEIVNKTTTSITLVSPNSLLTNQTASEYDSKNSMIISPQIADITPLYAKLDNEKQTAKIGVQLKNNYTSTISDVLLLGKIPFEGNQAVVSAKDLESEFTTKMINTGIEIPEELQGKVTVYYSENETPTKDISNTDNGWKTAENVTDWDNVKTFLIDFEDEQIEQGKEYTFYYKIQIPEGVEFNKVTYSHHGIYFCLDTDEGKYRTQTESNKLGFRIAEKFHLEIIKTQTGKDKKVVGAAYSIKEISADGTTVETKRAVTDEKGTILINELYAERTYEIQEIKSPDDYELNTDIIRIIGRVAEDGTLTIDKLQGTTKEDITVTKNNGEKHKVTVQVEDEAKPRLKIIKKEQGTETTVSYAKYRLTGYGLPTNGRILTTNVNGEIIVSGLKVNEEYTLEETKANGYYLAETIKFKIVNNDGVYSVETVEGTIAQSNVTEEDSLPIANLILENEKKQTYTLEINKIKKILQTELNTEETTENTTEEQDVEYLQGAKFKLYKGTELIGTYTTGADGKITIENLYQYVEGKDEEATYTLKEVIAPDGYAKVKDITFKVQAVDGTLTLINTSGKEEKYTVDGTTVKLTIEDSPSFKLINKDAETGEVLANVKFAIYNVDDEIVAARNSKGEIIGTKETINGKEYYTVTTDANGTITADLPEGYYKAVEVQAPDKYDIENSTYYFGIGGSREGEIGLKAESAKAIGGSLNDYINSVSKTSDGGYIVGGYFYSSSIDIQNGVTLINNSSSTSYSDGMIIKYNSEMKPEWAKAIGGSTNDAITSVSETSDGGYIVGGYFYDTSIDLGNSITLTNHDTRGDYEDAMIIKYSVDGQVEWAKAIGGKNEDRIYSVKETKDGGYIAGGYFWNTSIDLDNEITLTCNYGYDGMIIKYSREGETEWAKAIGGTSYNDYIKTVSETNDGGYVVGGYFQSSSIYLENGVTLANSGSTDGMIVKYSSEGVAQWAKAIGGSSSDYINAVSETSDGGCIVGGYLQSSSIDLENGATLVNSGNTDGMIVKYSSNGKMEWAKTVGGKSADYINSVLETSDGGYIAGGYFYSSCIDLGNEVIAANNSNYHTDTNKECYSDMILIKYNSKGEAEFAKAIGGSSNEYINSVAEISDGGYTVTGYFSSSSINLGNDTTLTNNYSSTNDYDGMIIKYIQEELPKVIIKQATEIEESNSDEANSVCQTTDGGYIVVGSSGIEKYSAEGVMEWSKSIEATIKSIIETSDGSYIAVGSFNSSTLALGNGIGVINNGSTSYSDGVIIKYTSNGEVKWAKAIGGSSDDYINSVAEISEGNYIIVGYFDSSSINLGSGITLTNNSNEMVIKIEEKMGAPEIQELTVENSRKEFKVTTSINEIDAVKGGKISGEDETPYEVVKYGDSTTKEIVMIPDVNYEIIRITVNGQEYNFEANEDDTYAMQLTNITEDKHIEVTYALKDNKIIINNVDAETQEKLSGATFRLDQIEERVVPESTIGSLTANGKDYGVTADTTREATDVLGELTANGQGYGIADTAKEVTDVLGELTSNGTYYFVEKDEKYVPNNSGKHKTTANSYITIDLTNKTGNYIVIVNANVSSENKYDLGYATITENTWAPAYNSTIGQFIYKSGTVEAQDYSSMILEGGKTYYLHLGYRKDNSTNAGTDQIIFNSIKVYEANVITYDFIENEEKYESTNQGQADTVANSYITIDLTNKEGVYAVVVNANVSSDRGDYGYATITENATRPAYNSTTGRFIYISGTSSAETTPTDYTSMKLEGGKTYYLHLGYYKNASIDLGDDKFTVNSINVYEADEINYEFIENEGKYESNNQGKDGTVANSYIPIDLTNCKGKYNLIVNANISSQEDADIGYATVTENTTRPEYSDSTERFIYISGTSEGATTPTDYTTVLEGGKIYYLHFGYYKNASISEGEDKFIVNSITIVPNSEDLYHTEVTTNSKGQAITQIPFGKYIVKEIVAPEGYELNENSTIIELRKDENNEFTIENNKIAKVIVHHYIKGTTTKVAEDDLLQHKSGYRYTTLPKLDLEKYALEKAEDGSYIIPENAMGQFKSGEQEVIYYYIEKEIPLVVNHYIEGTEDAVPLLNGDKAESITTYGNAGDTYKTTAISDSELSGDYELVEVPSNSTGIYEGEKIEVTYYYRSVVRNLTINKYQEDGVTPLEGAKFTIVNKNDASEIEPEEYTTNSKGKIEVTLEAGEYIVTEVQAPVGYQLPEDPTEEIVISKTFGNIALNIINTKEQGKVTVHHYIENTTVSVLLEDGTQAQDIVKTGPIGEIYATKALENVDSRFELVGEPVNASGTITKDEIEVTYYYKKPEIEEKMTVEKQATDEITSTETRVYYEIKFTATLNYFDGNAKVTLVDTLPYSIDVTESELAGGTYDEETRTITWVEEINDIEVLINEMTIERTKILNLKYNYGNIDETTEQMQNKVNAKIELLEPSKENPDKYVLVKEDIQEATAETLIKIPAEVIVHHYIYDAEKDEYTTIKLAEDDTINGVIGQEYKTLPSTAVPGNYSPVNITPEKHEGKMAQETIEVTYYYQLMASTVESTINKIAVANKQDANKVAILTKEDGVVTYNIKYNISIKDYIGKATVEIVDTLPYNIDEEKSDFAGGIYDKETNTITWTETLEVEIDTYANGTFTTVVTKQIKIVYKNQDLTNHIVNTVEGKVKTYYPENHTSSPGEEIIASIARDDEAVIQEYKVNLKVEKQWEDNDNLKGKRPETVTIEIKGMPNGESLEQILNAENNWSCEITDLPKYDAKGNKVVYEVTERETVERDLEYYDNPVIVRAEDQTEEVTNYVFIVKNAYKLLNTDLKAEISKTGTEEITSSKQEVEYTINFKAEIIEYIGAGKVKIVDTLPYKIDEEKSDLANGVYDDITQTITWVDELSHINTEISGENYKTDITKQIKVVYKDIDLTTLEMTNKVNGKVELYESEVKDEKEAAYNTKIDVKGKVIVNYIDMDTGEHIDKNYTYEISEKVGSTYTAEKKEIENYEYIQSSNNETGIITQETQEVIYYYSRIKTSVLVKHQDTDGNELAEDVLINGKILDEYKAEAKEIENYRVVEVPDNKEGIMTKEQIVVIYVYEKIPTKVIVKYIYKDIETGEEKEISPEETIEGFSGDEYITERKVITNYKVAEPEPTNKTGKMLPDPIEVIYYYDKIPSGIITVKYVDIDTEEEIAYKTETEQSTYREEIKGFVGDEYTTKEKEIPYYEFVKTTDNAKGILTEKGDTVIYYYRKQKLDFSVEKTIKEISLNGRNVKVPDDKLIKIELKPSKIEETEIIITYEIAVKNQGEIKGKATIIETLPQGYEIIEKEDRWQENEGVLETEVELDVGETEELTIKQKWLNTTENLGYRTKNVEISRIENIPNFEDTTEENNISSAGVIINVNSGGKINSKMQVILPIVLATSLYVMCILIITIKKEKLNKK